MHISLPLFLMFGAICSVNGVAVSSTKNVNPSQSTGVPNDATLTKELSNIKAILALPKLNIPVEEPPKTKSPASSKASSKASRSLQRRTYTWSDNANNYNRYYRRYTAALKKLQRIDQAIQANSRELNRVYAALDGYPRSPATERERQQLARLAQDRDTFQNRQLRYGHKRYDIRVRIRILKAQMTEVLQWFIEEIHLRYVTPSLPTEIRAMIANLNRFDTFD